MVFRKTDVREAYLVYQLSSWVLFLLQIQDSIAVTWMLSSPSTLDSPSVNFTVETPFTLAQVSPSRRQHSVHVPSSCIWVITFYVVTEWIRKWLLSVQVTTAGRAVWQACSSPDPCQPSSLRLNSSRSWIHQPWLMGHFTGSLCPEPSSLSSSPFALSTVLRLGSLPPPSFPPVFFSLLFLFSFPFLFPPLASPFLSFPFGYFRISCMLLVQKHGFFAPFL